MRGRTGGARFTGASASSKVVSGKSTRGAADTQTATPNKTRTNIQRIRNTLLNPDFAKLLRRELLVNASPNRAAPSGPDHRTSSPSPEPDPARRLVVADSANARFLRYIEVRNIGLGGLLLASPKAVRKHIRRSGARESDGIRSRSADLSG